jgi:hypothetical protein
LKYYLKYISCLVSAIFYWGCQNEPFSKIENSELLNTDTQFKLLSPKETKIHFASLLKETPDINVLVYEYFYNGGGVATGDFNGDNLIDIYFTSSMSSNKFYLNKGNLQFEEVSEKAKVQGRNGSWKTGVTHVDINGDGKLDLFLCYSGALPDAKRKNQLFINLGNNAENIPIFQEQSAKYGLDSPAFSNQGYFFDYDKDGDLDMLLLNHNPQSLPLQNQIAAQNMLQKPDSLMGLRLLVQENERFQDITEEAGISGSALSYGLGLSMGDLNQDGWTDFYISNDYDAPDYLYLNNKDGTFTDSLGGSIGHISQFSMGNDIADVNNNGLMDIVTLDMLPESNERQKLLIPHNSYTKFDLTIQKGFHHQNMRNMMQINNGDGTFSEIGQLAGIDKTDWSWSPLLADFDNDGWKDLHVTNGYFRDFTNMDFINYMDEFTTGKTTMKRANVLELVKHAPKSDFVNYIFKNEGNQKFSNVTEQWGLQHISNSNGAAYADLDNDGDLEIIVNNINRPAFVYENLANKKQQNYLNIQLEGNSMNTQGIGANVQLFFNEQMQKISQFPTRGYLSTVSPILHFGLGEVDNIDSLKIVWESGLVEIRTNIEANQKLVLKEKNAINNIIHSKKLIDPIFKLTKSPIPFIDSKNPIRDFDRQALLTRELSNTSPCMVKGDLNGDSITDIFIGGSFNSPSKIFHGTINGQFIEYLPFNSIAKEDTKSHDVDAGIFDINNDGHNDIYVASGGYHTFTQYDKTLQNRIYLNDGKGNFTKIINTMPKALNASRSIAIHDVNGDGYTDIFVAGAYIPGRYPETSLNQLLINDGKGNFVNKIKDLAPVLESFGEIRKSIWVDLNNDNSKDLVVVGEWLPVSAFINKNGKLENETKTFFPEENHGWWNTISSADINNDGRPDFIVGNLGLNTYYQASKEEPIELVYADFDKNGSIDPFLNYYKHGKSYPDVSRNEIVRQLSNLSGKYISYELYANETMETIFSGNELKNTKTKIATRLETTFYLSNSKGTYDMKPLPVQIQYAPIEAIQFLDFDNDGALDVLLCGNSSSYKISVGKLDANYGILLKGNGKGDFEYIDQLKSGLRIKGDVKCILKIDSILFFGINEMPIMTYQMK